MDKCLKIGGKLAFVLKQTLYKSIAGKEFRKFCIEKKGTTIPVKVIKVHDLLKLKPFKYSGSETSVAILEKVGSLPNHISANLCSTFFSLKPRAATKPIKRTFRTAYLYTDLLV